MTKEDTEKNKNIASFNEEDAAALVKKYDANTMLTLLQEMANYPDSKFDWNKLIEETSTGISNAREYQMLWRHLAYGHALDENLDDDAQPLDDDSDVECEREAPSSITNEAASEAASCAKVITDSHVLSECAPTSALIKAPLTISVPVSGSFNEEGSSQPSNLIMQETNIAFPVTVPRVAIRPSRRRRGPAGNAAGTSGGGSAVSKRKGKAWSEEEDIQLRALIERWGEGNWAYMAKREDFSLERTAAQLAKRWSTLRKKDEIAKLGTMPTSSQHNADDE